MQTEGFLEDECLCPSQLNVLLPYKQLRFNRAVLLCSLTRYLKQRDVGVNILWTVRHAPK